MVRQVKKNKILIRNYFIRSLIQSLLYFFVLITWQTVAFSYNKKQIDLPPSLLILFLLIFIIWFSCYFEIRTITLKEERFLGYKSYILWLLKLCYLPVIVLCTYIIGINTESIVYLLMVNCGAVTLYYIYFVCIIYPYRSFIKNNSGELYISYQVRVKKWYIEGAIV